MTRNLNRAQRFALDSVSRWPFFIELAMALVLLLAGPTFIPSTAGAADIAQKKAHAADLYAQIERVSAQVQSLGQAYDLAQLRSSQISKTIVSTRRIVNGIERKVGSDTLQLKADAVVSYVDGSSTVSKNVLFSGGASNVGATNVYRQLADGNVGMAIASLKSDHVRLVGERGVLLKERSHARATAKAAAAALVRARTLQRSLDTARSQVEGQISVYYAELQAAAVAASARAMTTAVQNTTSTTVAPPPSSALGSPAAQTVGAPPVATPPPSSIGAAAVLAAEKYIGVWYVWGGASPSGLDCSGLVMLAYQAVGVSLPHYSGAQYADTIRVPLGDIQPGDLLFYGPGGSEHESMYVGNGMMIEAPQTGYRVNITPVRLGYGFVGVGRVRA